MTRIVLFFLSLFCFLNSFAQQKYWINFTDKDLSHYSYQTYLSAEAIQNRVKFNIPLYQFSDVPVNINYINTVKSLGIKVEGTSRWFNSVSAALSEDQIIAVKNLPFVKDIEPVLVELVIAEADLQIDPEMYHMAMKQMQSEVFLDSKISGEGVTVGVIDAGFYKAHTDKFLSHLFEEKRIKGQRDFLNPERTDLIKTNVTDADQHGRMVLDMITGYDQEKKIQTGLATNASFYLARTEDGDSESRREEDLWIMAMEWMDSLGVRLISTSLGYAINMTDPKENYKQEDMNGHTTRISKAAQMATDEKGIFLCVSAGNEGSNPEWVIISSPADAKGVLSVGATRDQVWDKIGYSSIGPDFLPYMKPNVSVFSPNGTSFSCPALAGFVACLMQADPSLDNKKLKEIVEKSAHLYPYGNNFLGYGIPQASIAMKLIKDTSYQDPDRPAEKRMKKTSFKLQLDKSINADAILFHKKNETIVLAQEVTSIKNGKLKVKKAPGAVRSTLVVGRSVVEIIWEP